MSNIPNTIKSEARAEQKRTGAKYTRALKDVLSRPSPLSSLEDISEAIRVLDTGMANNPCWTEDTRREARVAVTRIIRSRSSKRGHLVIVNMVGCLDTGVYELSELIVTAANGVKTKPKFLVDVDDEYAQRMISSESTVLGEHENVLRCEFGRHSLEAFRDWAFPRAGGDVAFAVRVPNPDEPALYTPSDVVVHTHIPSEEGFLSKIAQMVSEEGFTLSSEANERLALRFQDTYLPNYSLPYGWLSRLESISRHAIDCCVARWAAEPDTGTPDTEISLSDIEFAISR